MTLRSHGAFALLLVTALLSAGHATRGQRRAPRTARSDAQAHAAVQARAAVVVIGDDARLSLDSRELGTAADNAGLLSARLDKRFREGGGRSVVVKVGANLLVADVCGVLSAVMEGGAKDVRIEGHDGVELPYLKLAEMIYPVPERGGLLKANPFFLVVKVASTGDVTLNGTQLGSLRDTSGMKARLAEIFEERRKAGIYKEGMERRADLPDQERIERAVFIVPSRALTFETVIKLAGQINAAGGSPVGLQVDNLPR